MKKWWMVGVVGMAGLFVPLLGFVASATAAESSSARPTATQRLVVQLRQERARHATTRASLANAQRQLRTAISERDAARAELAAARALVTADVSTRIAAMTNDEIWDLVWDAVLAFESGCPWGDSTFVGSGLSSVTFERTSSSFC